MAKLILGIENPLLDISVNVDQAYLDKYKKTAGTASLANENDKEMFKEIVTFPDVQYIAGGACQNSIRGAQWISPTKGITHFIGSVGNDGNAQMLTQVASKDGVQTHYYVSKTHNTGTCAVLILDKERCLCAELGAANDYQHSHFESEEIQNLVKKVGLVYTSGYFITVSPKTIIELGKHCAENNKLFAFSIAAPFVPQYYWETVQEIVSYADYIICNREEAVAFLEKAGLPHDNLVESAKLVAELPKVNSKRTRTVIFTQSSDPTITYHNGKTEQWPVVPIEKDKIVDSNGAGDAFAGGIIAGLAHDKPLAECIRAAMFNAHHILQVSGSQYPEKCTFKWQ